MKGPRILVIEGRLHAAMSGNPMALITVSGDGDPIVIDRIGDDDHFHPGDVDDVPSRSIELMRAPGSDRDLPVLEPGGRARCGQAVGRR